MENRPEWTQIWWESYWNFDAMFWTNLIILLIVIAGFLIALDENKLKEKKKKQQSENGEKEIKKEMSFKKKMVISGAIVATIILTLNLVGGSWAAKYSAKTTEDFFENATNKMWFEKNIEGLYKDVKREEYKIMKIDTIYSLEEDGKEIEEIIYSSDGEETMLFGSYEIGVKQQHFSHWLKKEKRNKQAHYIKMTVRTPENNIKKIAAVVDLKVVDEGVESQAYLATTREIKDDPGEEVYYGEVSVPENFFE